MDCPNVNPGPLCCGVHSLAQTASVFRVWKCWLGSLCRDSCNLSFIAGFMLSGPQWAHYHWPSRLHSPVGSSEWHGCVFNNRLSDSKLRRSAILVGPSQSLTLHVYVKFSSQYYWSFASVLKDKWSRKSCSHLGLYWDLGDAFYLKESGQKTFFFFWVTLSGFELCYPADLCLANRKKTVLFVLSLYSSDHPY